MMIKKMVRSFFVAMGMALVVSAQVFGAESREVQAQQLDRGETVKFANESDMFDFMEFYQTDYRLKDYSNGAQVLKYSDGTLGLQIPEANREDREALKSVIVNTFGQVSGNSIEEKITDACSKVSVMQYDVTYAKVSIDQALNNKVGVCWHFAKSAMVLLEDAGVNCEMVQTEFRGAQHLILKCDNGGEWIYVDPTSARVDASYTIMDASTFTERYTQTVYYKNRQMK